MIQRSRVLVADKDLNSLSRIYLALLHRNYKVEATNLTDEIAARTKRLKPAVIILGFDEYETVKEDLKTAAIVLIDNDPSAMKSVSGELIFLEKNVSIEILIKTIEELAI